VDNIWPQLEGIFRDVFDDPKLSISPATTAQDIPMWDSLAHINLVMAIESEFRIKFALGEIQELQNVGEMAALIQKKTAKA
jgi:acyl carrier protein